MKVRVQSVNFTADQKLVNFIQAKMDKLETYFDRVIDGEVFLKVDNNHTKQNKISEIKLNIPAHELVVKKQCKSFEEAAQLGADALKRQLSKHKEKVKALAS